MSYVKQFCEKYGYEHEAISFLDKAFTKLQQNTEAYSIFTAYVEAYEENYSLDHMTVLAAIRALEECTGIHKYTLVLLYLICLTKHLGVLYENEGIAADIYDFSVCDLKWKAKECHTAYGVWGNYVGGWEFGFFKMERFAIGRLQYEIRAFPFTIDTGVVKIDKGEPYINVHIPSCGPLNDDACMESYEKATDFFQKRYHLKRIIFGCNSWLLSPDLQLMLPVTSRIRVFAEHYTILEVIKDPLNKHLDKIFGVRTLPENIDELPENTNLRYTMKRWLKAGNSIDTALGVFIPNFNKID